MANNLIDWIQKERARVRVSERDKKVRNEGEKNSLSNSVSK